MGQQIRRHESAVTVAADAHAVRVRDAHLRGLVNRRLRAHDNLLDVGIVHRLGVADDGHRRVVEHGVAREQEEEMRRASDGREALRRACHLPCGRGVCVFERVGPDDRRQPRALLVAGRQVEREGALHAVRALVSDELFLDAVKLRRRVRELSERAHGARAARAVRAFAEVAYVIVERLDGTLAARDNLVRVVRQESDKGFVALAVAAEESFALQRCQV